MMNANPNSPELSEELIRKQLQRVLDSTTFLASKRISQFLTFIVMETLAGRADRIKGYTIGVEVYGRDASFDSVADSLVRVEAGRLRRMLSHYYEHIGKNDPVRIEVPKGTYVPRFTCVARHLRNATSASKAPEPKVAHDQTITQHSARFFRPSIVVLPFNYSEEDLLVRNLAEAIAEEVTTALNRFPGLAVVARQSAMHYRKGRVKIKAVATDLRVRFVTCGTVRKYGDNIRVVIDLTDAASSKQLWSRTFQANLATDGFFEIADIISREAAIIIGGEYGIIANYLSRELDNKHFKSLTPHEATLLYYRYNMDLSKKAHAEARQALEHTLSKVPGYALGWAQLAGIYADMYTLNHEGPVDALSRALELAHRSLAIDSTCLDGQYIMAYIRFLKGEHTVAIRKAEMVIKINPNSAYLVSCAGMIIGFCGKLDRSREILREVEKLNPYQPGYMHMVNYIDHMQKGEYRDALKEAGRFGAPGLAWASLSKAAASGHIGDPAQAASYYNEFVQRFPRVAENPAKTICKLLHFDPWINTMVDGLEKAKQAASDR